MLSILGQMIKQLREENSLTIQELSARTGVSVEKLGEIENNLATPSLGVLIKISRVLGSRLGTLLDGHEHYGAVVTKAKQEVPADTFSGADHSQHEHLNFYSLAQGKNDRHMEPLLINVNPSNTKVELKSEHEGEEFIHVLEGDIELHYGHDRHLLSKGDSIYYDSIVPHCLVNTSGSNAKVLAIIYTPY